MNILQGILVSLFCTAALYLLRLGWYRLIDRPHKKETVTAAQVMMGRLKEKGMGNWLLRDCVFHTRITESDIRDLDRLAPKLSALEKEIAAWLNQPKAPHLNFYRSRLPEDDRLADYDHGTRSIDVYYQRFKNCSPEKAIAAMCHESAHWFMYCMGLAQSDPVKNERDTDITACLLGFSVYMIAGNYTLGNTRAISKRGYLKSAEMQAIRDYLLACRQQSQAEKSV